MVPHGHGRHDAHYHQQAFVHIVVFGQTYITHVAKSRSAPTLCAHGNQVLYVGCFLHLIVVDSNPLRSYSVSDELPFL